MFDFFDNDKSGSINIREMDQVLKKLDIKLSQDGYNQLMKEFDRDGKYYKSLFNFEIVFYYLKNFKY